MEKRQLNIVEPIVDIVMGLWKRSDRDFSKKSSRDAFRTMCCKVLKGESVEIEEPSEDTPRDSVDWARYVAASDCQALAKVLDNMTALLERSTQRVYSAGDESDSDSEYYEGMMPFPYVIRKRRRNKINPNTDRRFKANKTQEQNEKQQKVLEQARIKARQVFEVSHGLYTPVPVEPTPIETAPEVTKVNNIKDMEAIDEDAASTEIDFQQDYVAYAVKRKRNSQPQKVPLPPMPQDYRLENEWVKANIKSPDMLYSYVRMKSGDGITWSGGLRKYFNNNDFWEFAFDTLSSGGWCDSEHNKPICNIAKYITKATIGEFERHEASKHSRFEGKFKTGKELLEYISIHVSGIRAEFRNEGFCDWFLQQMNDMGWRWNNGTTINNIPGQMSKMYNEYVEWKDNNRGNLAGVSESQYGTVSRIHKAIEKGEWKPTAEGKFSAMDLKKFL